MEPKPKEHQLAHELYFHADKTQTEIAEILNVNRRTVYMWIKNGKWAEMKLAARQTPAALVQDFYNHITAINDQIAEREDKCPTPKEVEMMRKLVGMTKDIKKRHTATYIEVFEEIMFFVREFDHEFAIKFSQYASDYIKGYVGDESFRTTKARKETIKTVRQNLAKENTPTWTDDMTIPEYKSDDVQQHGFWLSDEAKRFVPLPARPKEEDKTVEPQHFSAPHSTDLNTPRNTSAPLERSGEAKREHDGSTMGAAGSTKTPRNISSPSERSGEVKREQNGSTMGAAGSTKIQRNISSPSERSGEVSPYEDYMDEISFGLDRVLHLPPAERPSPYRDGNVLWVNNIDDVDERLNNFGKEWGERKMGDIIRRYSSYNPIYRRAS